MSHNMDPEKIGFTPISVDDFLQSYYRNNPGASKKEIKRELKRALADYRRGVRCQCGAPIWVIGSAIMGNACFTCITKEAVPESDYELEQAM